MRICAYDSETHLISSEDPFPPLVCGTFCLEGEEPFLTAGPRDTFEALRRLDDGETVFVAHNAGFDIGVLIANGFYSIAEAFDAIEAGKWRCTQIRETLRCLCYKGQVPGADTLADLSMKYLGKDRFASKTDPNSPRLRFAEVDLLDIEEYPPDFVAYALEDTDVLEIHSCQVQRVQEFGGVALDGAPFLLEDGEFVNERKQLMADLALKLTAARGMRSDPATVAALDKWVADREPRVEALGFGLGILKRAGTKKAPKIAQDQKATRGLVVAAYAKQGMSPPMTEGGKVWKESGGEKGKGPQVAINEEAILESDDDALIEWFTANQEINKLRSTYLPIARRGVLGPVVGRFDVLKVTGRAGMREPSFMNPPQKGGFRECWIPSPPDEEAPEGYYFVSCDYEGAELCALAQICYWWFGHSELRNIINSGGSPHEILASDLSGRSVEEINAALKAGEEWAEEAKSLAKATQFGFMGGLGPKNFGRYAKGYGVTLSQDRCYEAKEVWLNRYPEMRDYLALISRIAENGGNITIPSSGRPLANRIYTAAANGYFQAMTADWAKDATVEIVRRTGPGGELEGLHNVLFIHDENIAEVRKSRATFLSDRMAEIMVNVAQEYTPDVTQRVQPALMERWYKKVKTLRSPTGELLPWRPPTKDRS